MIVHPTDSVVQRVCGHGPLAFRRDEEGEVVIRPCPVCDDTSTPTCPACGKAHWKEIADMK